LETSLEASQWPPLDPQAGPEIFLAQARAIMAGFADRVILGLMGNVSAHTDAASLASLLTRSGENAVEVLLAEFRRRVPSASSAGLREDLAAAFDGRLLRLARGGNWTAGAA
jgi:hypothetical protein